MKTKTETRSLGEERSTYTTNSSIRQNRQKDMSPKKAKGGASTGAVAFGLLAGAAAGAIAGVLLAPDRGTATRKKVAESASKLGNQVSKGYSATKSKVGSWTGKKSETDANSGNNMQGDTRQKSPYTDSSKWDDTEVNRMVNDARRTPGL